MSRYSILRPLSNEEILLLTYTLISFFSAQKNKEMHECLGLENNDDALVLPIRLRLIWMLLLLAQFYI